MNIKSVGVEQNKKPEQADFSIKHRFLAMTDTPFENISEETTIVYNSSKE